MRLVQLLEEKRSEIEEKWLKAALSVYPDKSVSFLNSRKSPFANPVGTLLRRQIGLIVQKLIDDEEIDAFHEPLSDLARIRAVQELAPARALEFLFSVKSFVADGAPEGLQGEVRHFEEKIDRLVLLAFDLYEGHRAQIFELRVKEIKRACGIREKNLRDPRNPRRSQS